MRSPSTQPPNTGEYAGPPIIWFCFSKLKRYSPGRARVAPGVLASELIGVVRVGLAVRAAQRRLRVAAYHVQAVAEHRARQAVARGGHRRPRAPGVRRRGVGLE